MLPEDRERLSNWRGRRLYACRANDEIHNLIEMLGVEDGSQLPLPGGYAAAPMEIQKEEMKNLATTLMRMILIWNDGHVSSSKLNRF